VNVVPFCGFFTHWPLGLVCAPTKPIAGRIVRARELLRAARLFDSDSQCAEAAQDVVQHALFFLDAEPLDPTRERGE
jgi:hypothetical protein